MFCPHHIILGLTLIAIAFSPPIFALPQRRLTARQHDELVKRATSLTGSDAPPLNSSRPGDPIITPSGSPAPTATPYYVAPAKPLFNYAEGVHLAQIWYEIQRSGPIETQRLAWRASSCFVCKGQYGEDLSGAWYEAANTMKWGLPLSWTVMQLAYNVYQYGDTLATINELNQALTVVKWGTDYLINAHHNDTTFVGQLGISGIGDNQDIDFSYYIAPETYEQRIAQQYWHPVLYITPRSPAGDIVAESAAALAVASMIFRPYNSSYADLCLTHAESLYKFAVAYPTSYNIPANSGNKTSPWYAASGWYPSTSVNDDIALAAVFLHLATNQTQYLNDSISQYNTASGQAAWSEESWDSQGGHLHVLLYQITKNPTYLTNFKAFANQYLPGSTQTIKQTPLGLSFPGYWGTITLVMNACMDMLTMSRIIGQSDPYSITMINFCTQQANYVLGEKGYTYMVGFGNGKYPLRINHISSYNPYDESPLYNSTLDVIENDFLEGLTPNRRIAYGAIPSGPDPNDHYQDDHLLYQYSESTQDSSAGIIGLLAGLIEWYGVNEFTPFSDCTLDLGFSHPNATAKPTYPADDCYHACNTGQNCNRAITVFGQKDSSVVHIEALATTSAGLTPSAGLSPTMATEANLASSISVKGAAIANVVGLITITFILLFL